MYPNPADPNTTGLRILTDRGIRTAIAHGFIVIDPPLHDAQIQPASIDLCFQKAELDGPAEERSWASHDRQGKHDPHVLYGNCLHDLYLTQRIVLPEVTSPLDHCHFSFGYEARSSLRRLGIVTPSPGLYIDPAEGHPYIQMTNMSMNDIAIPVGERIVQFFMHVNPLPFGEQREGKTEMGEMVRSLDMGVEVRDPAMIRALHRNEFTITPQLTIDHMYVVVHASATAYRFKHLGTINFAKRQELRQDDILEPVDLRRGYEIKSGEHLIVETREELHLSPTIGILFMDNPLHMFTRGPPCKRRRLADFAENVQLACLSDGWVDPGYSGSFSRQPKWFTPGRMIRPGDPLGWGRVFYFPNGTERVYGSTALGSQYQAQERTRLAKL